VNQKPSISSAVFIQLLLSSEIYHGEETIMIIGDLGSEPEVPGIVFRFPAGERGDSVPPERPHRRVLIKWVKQPDGEADLVPGLGMKSLSQFQFIYPHFRLDYPGI
jgi:hypothetical protein